MLIIDAQQGDRRVEVKITPPGGEAQTVSFTVAPENLEDTAQAVDTVRFKGFQGGDALAVSLLLLANRIKAWEGLADAAGQPLPCTRETKARVFGLYPGALMDIARELAAQEAAETKNSGTSPAG